MSKTWSCLEGSSIGSGAGCTPRCADGYAPSQTYLRCLAGELRPRNVTCIAVVVDVPPLQAAIEVLKFMFTSGLLSGNFSILVPGAQIYMQPLQTLDVEPGGGARVPVGSSGALGVSLPASFLKRHDGEPVALLLTIQDGTMAMRREDGTAVQSSAGNTLDSPSVSVRLFTKAGGFLQVDDLPDPANITVRANSSAAPGASCVFFNEVEGSWSALGLDTVHIDGQLVCSTAHFTLFAAISNLAETKLKCVGPNPFSLTALDAISAVTWAFQVPAVLLWLLFGCCLATILLGRREDQLSRPSDWQEIGSQVTKKRRKQGKPTTWRAYPMQMLKGGCKRMRQAACRLISKERWRRISDAMQLKILEASVTIIISARHKVLPEIVHNKLWSESGLSLVAPALAMESIDQKVSCMKLEVHAAFTKHFRSRCFLSRCLIMFVAMHPFSRMRCVDTSLSSTQRAKLLSDTLTGAMMIATLFMAVTRSALGIQSAAECTAGPEDLSRFLLLGAASSLLVKVPLRLVAYGYCRVSKLRVRPGPDAAQLQELTRLCAVTIFWGVGTLFTLFCLLYLVGFLATLQGVEHWKWLAVYLTVLINCAIALPLVQSFTMSLLAEVVIRRRQDLGERLVSGARRAVRARGRSAACAAGGTG